MKSARLTAMTIASGVLLSVGVHAQDIQHPFCDEEVFFDPENAQDIFAPPGYEVEVFAAGLDFPADIAFRGNKNNFEVFVTQTGSALPGRCNAAVDFPGDPEDNPFLPQVAVLDMNGDVKRVLGRPASVMELGEAGSLNPPTIGIAFERGFQGGRLFVSDSRQQLRDPSVPSTNSSRIVELDPWTGTLSPVITGLPTGDHPTEQIAVRAPYIYWAQGSATNSGIVGHDNGAPIDGPAEQEPALDPFATQHEIPCEDVVLSGNNFSSGDGHVTGGYLPHGVPGGEGDVVPAFSGATQDGMCTGAILRARLDNPQDTVEPFSWGYRNPFGIRFAPENHPLQGALAVVENGEDLRGARPVARAPDRLHVTVGGPDFHGWPDRFGFLPSTQRIFNPEGAPLVDDPAASLGNPVLPVLSEPPQPPKSPLAIEPADIALDAIDFVPRRFAGRGFPGTPVGTGDALVTRGGDFGFTAGNGEPILGHDIQRISFVQRNPRNPSAGDFNDFRGSSAAALLSIETERFIFNCKRENQVDGECTQPANQGFVDEISGFNHIIDGEFGPDGAFYVVDIGAIRDVGQSTPGSAVQDPADLPFVQMPGTGVIWRISKVD